MNLSDLGKNALQVVKTFAPTVATALGGPLAGMATQKILGIFGGADTATTEAAILGATPAQLADLQKAEDDFKVEMQRLKVSEEQLLFADVANARSREIAVKDRTPHVLAATITLGFFSVLSLMFWKGVPQSGGEALLVMLGALGTAWGSIVQYYYGSSAGSAAKTDAINQIAKGKTA